MRTLGGPLRLCRDWDRTRTSLEVTSEGATVTDQQCNRLMGSSLGGFAGMLR